MNEVRSSEGERALAFQGKHLAQVRSSDQEGSQVSVGTGIPFKWLEKKLLLKLKKSFNEGKSQPQPPL